MKGLIAAGGKGTRLRPITYSLNKHLFPLAGRPLLEHAIRKMAVEGIREIAINVNPGETEIQKVLGDGSRFGVTLTYLEQEGGPRGVGHIVMNAKEWIAGEPFVFYLGDNVTLGPLTSLIEKFERERLDCLLALSRMPNLSQFGVPEIQDGRIIRVVEKPKDPPSPFAVTGIYLYRPTVFEAAERIVPSARGEYEISDIHSELIAQGRNVGFEEVTGWWRDTGTPEDLLETNALLLEQMQGAEISPKAMIEPGARIHGLVSIGAKTRIGANTIINGPAWIGEGCRITDAEIGSGTSVGDDVTLDGIFLARSLVMDKAEIRGKGAIRDSIVGRSSRVSFAGMEATRSTAKLLLGDHGVVEY